MKKAAKKTAKGKPKTVNKIVKETAPEELVQEAFFEELGLTDAEPNLEQPSEFIPDLEGVDSKPTNEPSFSEKEEQTYNKFVDVYSPVIITRDNSRLDVGRNGQVIIKVRCPKSAQGSMPKFVDGITIVFE